MHYGVEGLDMDEVLRAMFQHDYDIAEGSISKAWCWFVLHTFNLFHRKKMVKTSNKRWYDLPFRWKLYYDRSKGMRDTRKTLSKKTSEIQQEWYKRMTKTLCFYKEDGRPYIAFNTKKFRLVLYRTKKC